MQRDEFYNLDHAERLSFHRDTMHFVFWGTGEAKIDETSRVTIHMKKAVNIFLILSDQPIQDQK